MNIKWSAATALLLFALPAAATEERAVDPTFLHRFVPKVAEKTVAISSASAHYRPLFGEGDKDSRTLRGITRFGELRVDAGGRSARVSYPREENILVILEGEGTVSYVGQPTTVRANDYVYLPAGVEFGLNGGRSGVRAILMGYKIPQNMPITVPAGIMKANINDVPLVTVGNHPPSTLYRLLMGDTKSKRDKLSTGHLMVSLFVMEFAPGGTNFPHHHETQEEIYLMLDGKGEMVAGGGMDGIEGRFRAKPGDAYFYRQNTTVGFYNDKGGKPARILAVRNNVPPKE
jgi:mannose-6-phosphate isomerase-like protein (cupin superfamily)